MQPFLDCLCTLVAAAIADGLPALPARLLQVLLGGSLLWVLHRPGFETSQWQQKALAIQKPSADPAGCLQQIQAVDLAGGWPTLGSCLLSLHEKPGLPDCTHGKRSRQGHACAASAGPVASTILPVRAV